MTKDQIAIIESINFDKKHTKSLRAHVKIYYENKIDYQILKNNWQKIILLGRDSSSLYAQHIRYGEEYGNILHIIKGKACSRTREDVIKKYGEEKGLEILQKYSSTLENFIRRHGNEIGIVKWNEYCYKRSSTFKSRRGTYARRNLAWFREKYGEEKGYTIWNNKRTSQAYKVSKKYYIERYGEELGAIKIKECKSRGLEFYIKKHGEELGRQKHTKRVLANISYLRFRASKWSLECINLCKESVTDLLYYDTNEMIWQLPAEWQEKLKQRCICPDLFYRGKIIEFQGDAFHANPTLYAEFDHPHPRCKILTSLDIWKKDKLRIDYYNSKGYKTLQIWENDFYADKEKVISECMNFLQPMTK